VHDYHTIDDPDVVIPASKTALLSASDMKVTTGVGVLVMTWMI